MPFVDLPKSGLRQYYAINPHCETARMIFDGPEPPSRTAIDPAKPVLVLTHAGTSSSASFIHQFRDARLAASLNLVAFDSRYYGRTGNAEKLPRYQDLEERADELLEAIDAVVGDRPFSWLGESFVGAHTGAYVVAKRPQQVKAMILISPSFVEDPVEMCEVLENEWAPFCAANKNGQGDGTGRIPDGAMDIVRDYFFSGSTHEPERQQAFIDQYQFQHGPGEDMYKINQLLHWFRRKSPPPAVFEAIRCPTLLLGGTKDQTVNPADALKQWYDLLVNVPAEDKRIERIVDGTHFLATTDSNLVNRFLLAFLQRYNLALPLSPAPYSPQP
ncbi:hypothetical protein JCM10207_001953 [Rhodosporidiobolus poonsookiae]